MIRWQEVLVMSAALLGGCASKPVTRLPPVLVDPPIPESESSPESSPTTVESSAASTDPSVPPPAKAVLSIDAGPRANTFVRLDERTQLPEPEATELCAEARERHGLACYDAEPCTCHVVSVGRVGTTSIALVVVGGGMSPGTRGAMALIVRQQEVWKPLQELGTSEGGFRGECGNQVSLHTLGAADLGDAGSWIWADVMDAAYSIGGECGIAAGTTWTRTLWLCGGTHGIECRAVPLKSWWSGWIAEWEDFQKAWLRESGAKMPTTSEVPMYALAATLDDAGILSIRAKTKLPSDLQGIVGSHPLATLGSVPGVR